MEADGFNGSAKVGDKALAIKLRGRMG